MPPKGWRKSQQRYVPSEAPDVNDLLDEDPELTAKRKKCRGNHIYIKGTHGAVKCQRCEHSMPRGDARTKALAGNVFPLETDIR